MNVTQLLLSSTAVMLLGALLLSYSIMRKDEAGIKRTKSAKLLIEENARLQEEINILKSRSPSSEKRKITNIPQSFSQTKLVELQKKNEELSQQLADIEKAHKENAPLSNPPEQEFSFSTPSKQERRAKMITQAMVMALVKEVAPVQGEVQLLVLDVKIPQSISVGTELAIRRSTGIIGRVIVSNIDQGDYFADPIGGSFPGGQVDIQVGDELIIPL